MRPKQPWLRSARTDLCLILGPPLFASALILLLPAPVLESDAIPPWSWLLLILGVDVAHVYGTLFRTYLDQGERKRRGALLLGIPIAGWAVGALLYSAGELVFWRTLAYLAVFHFIRQQYGFMRLYSRKDKAGGRLLDSLAIYSATLYPLLYWHLHLPRKFSWFMSGDFLALPASLATWAPGLERLAFAAFLGIQLAYFGRELRRARLDPGALNIPKNLIVLGTTCSWYLGIVVFNGDLAFTVLNIVSHGIPYLGLVWVTERARRPSRWRWKGTALFAFLGVVLVCAFLEEAFWDGLVWREHPQYFAWFYGMPLVQAGDALAILVPLLSLPQITHYVLDGFVWKARDPELLKELS